MFDETEDAPSDGTSPDALWGGGSLFDPFSGDSFSQEIANVDASDWDMDADLLWGDDATDSTDTDGDVPGADLFS